jgi:hypothetical protein
MRSERLAGHRTQRALLPDVIAWLAQRLYLECGLPLERLHTAALGVHQLQLGYWLHYRLQPDARTIHNWRQALLGEPVGHLPEWLTPGPFPGLKVKRKGANTYDLPRHPEVWRLVRAAIIEALSIRRRERRQRRTQYTQYTQHVRAQGALNWAISSAELGRNHVGYRLVLLLRKIGLDRSEVEGVLRDYQREVYAARPGPPYTWGEASSTLRSAWRRFIPLSV